ncbi:MAG: dihydrolipoyl dehydrogenase [Clostridia bacterium]|jgi:dihydrolipoamide dehydrogenase|nr:dihydrolipoyl dehydrogenase [Clostridia bacterium]
MAKLIVLPKLSIVMKEGTIIKWYFKEGDHVNVGDILYDVESGKTGGSAECDTEGTILKIIAGAGKKVKCGDAVAVIGAVGEDFESLIPKEEEKAEENVKKTSVAVIGGGPGGYVAAIRAAQLGADVTLIEKRHIGGTCLNEGCIPTKALLHSAEIFNTAKNSESIGVISNPKIDFTKVIENKNNVVKRLVNGINILLKSNGVKVIYGEASFIDKNTASIKTDSGNQEFRADKFIISTGSVPTNVPIKGIDSKQCIDSTGALSLDKLPKSMAVIGGGVIGVEMATVYSFLGTKVTVVEMLPRLVINMDKDMADIAEKSLIKSGADIKTSTKVISIEDRGDMAAVTVEKDGKTDTFEAEKVLVCIGRKPLIDGLNLEAAGVNVENGAIKANDRMETNISSIYAIGDCIGGTMLAHIASMQGETAAENIMGMDSRYDEKTNPTCVYTSPEMASVGYSEESAKKAGISYTVGYFDLAGNGKAIILNGGEGFVKIIAHSRSKKILGMQIIGPRATDLITEGALAIKMGAGLEDIANTIHSHPTVSEATREAALSALGRAIHG